MGQQTNVEAYQAYLKARYHYFKLNPEDGAKAKACVDEAIALDPNYAPAQALLARCYSNLAATNMTPGLEMAALAKAAALKALELNEIDPGTHATLASLAGYYDYDWKEALRQCQTALTCGPISPEDRAGCALLLSNRRRFEDALAVVQPAVAADPLSPLPRMALALTLLCTGAYDRSIEEANRLIELRDDFWPGYALLGQSCLCQGKTQDAIAAFEKGVQVAPWNIPFLGYLAGCYVRAGDQAHAQSTLAPLDASGRELFRALGYLPYYILCSDWEAAADAFEKGMEARHPITAGLAANPFFEEFRQTPRGRALLAKMHLDDIA
jgi:tetratricopeptide (TPR) repeat protein